MSGKRLRRSSSLKFVASWGICGFTLIEMLVVIGIIGVLAGLLLPALVSARERSRETACMSNLRQLYLAMDMYCNHYNEYYLSAARDINTTNNERWHGIRRTANDPFDPSKSRLAPYLGSDGKVKECPTFASKWQSSGAYEIGCGGYGMNKLYVGSKEYKMPIYWSNAVSTPSTFEDKLTAEYAASRREVREPENTILFADAAAPDSQYSGKITEYSFVEANYYTNASRYNATLYDSQPDPSYPLDAVDLTRSCSPSLHFRHSGHINVVWCDGHTSSEGPLWSRTLTQTVYSGPSDWTGTPTQVDYSKYQLGWFGPNDNSLFRLEKKTAPCVAIPAP